MRQTIYILILSAFCSAQNPYGRITGRVSDPSGAMIPGATVRARNVDTNVAATIISNTSGNYDLPNLVPGRYFVEAEADGFRQFRQGPMDLRVGDVLAIQVSLEIGSSAEQVTVTADAPLLQTANASMGQVVDSQSINELPIAGGNPLYLTQLTPGVIQTTSPGNAWLPQGIQPTSNAVVAGTRNGSSEFLIDGVPNMSRGGMVAFSPPPEMVQEFRVETAPFDASVGHFSGASINMVLKSGTNSPHGSLWFSHLSRPLMTRPFFVNRSIYDAASGPPTQEKIDRLWPYIKTNRYRASAGGPVRIPKVYNGRDRTFWMFGFDWLDRGMPEPRFMTVPTESERRGDLSALLALGSRYQIYDPATIRPAAGGRTTRQPLTGNVVPASRIDPTAARILSYYPLPNTTGDVEGRNNYFDPRIRRIDYKSQIVRVDHQFTGNHRMYISLSRYDNHESWGRAFRNDALGMKVDRFHRGIILDDVFTPTSTVVLNLRYGFTRLKTDRGPQSTPFDLASLGFPASLTRQLAPEWTGFPNIAIDGNVFTALGDEPLALNRTNRHTVAVTASTMRSEHSLRIGGELRIIQGNDAALGNVSPSIAFAPMWTKGPQDNSAAAPIGQGLASFLLGLPSGGSIDRSDTLALQSQFGALFIQDDWKATSRLTINAGLRWEVDQPFTERYNRMNRGFDLTAMNPIQAAARANYTLNPITQLPVSAFQTRGGILFAGIDGVPRAMRNTDWNNLAPRIGMAYKLGPKSVVRGGYGMFYQSTTDDPADASQMGYSQTTTLEPSIDNGVTFRAPLSNPFPDPLVMPSGAAGGLRTYLGRAIGFVDPTQPLGYMHRFTFNVQREMPGNLLVDVGYIGNRGRSQGVPEAYGATQAQYLSTSPVRDQNTIDLLSELTPNPFFGLPEFLGSGMTGRSLSRAQLLSPYPHFASVNTVLSRGTMSFNALFTRMERRFAKGFMIHGTWTWSKNMDKTEKLNPTDPEPTRTVSQLDRTHRATASGVLQLPFGKGRKWAGDAPGWVGAFIGGWSLQGIYIFQSGQPLNFGNVLFRGDIKDIALEPGERTLGRWFNTDSGFERDTRQQLQYNLRTFPLRFSGIRGPGISNLDMSIFKTFNLREGLRLQLRAEGQNAVNHPLFPTTANSPGMNPTASTFGQITQGENEQRRITLALKLMW